MSRYVDAELLEKAIDDAQISLETNNDMMWEINKPYYKGLAWARGILRDQPAADVAEVKHGHWKKEGCGLLVCSECDFEYDHAGMPDEGLNFCPNCGAIMDGGVAECRINHPLK